MILAERPYAYGVPVDGETHYQAYQGDQGLWGVEDDKGLLLYEPEFARMTAEAIADMENSADPPVDWFETERRLDLAGLPH